MTQRYSDKVALITGAGSGIGRAVTLRLAAEGCTVFCVDIDLQGLEETASLASAPLFLHQADLTEPASCADAIKACVHTHGRLDVLGNVAGITHIEHVADVAVHRYRRQMAINVDACFFLAQAAIPHLLETGGNIVNIASSAGLMGQAYTAVYCMSKGAIVQLTRALAMEFIKTSLRVNAIAPGTTETPLTKRVRIPDDVDFQLMQPYVGHRTAASAEDVAGLFAYLASSDARSVHGAVLSIDNGVTAG